MEKQLKTETLLKILFDQNDTDKIVSGLKMLIINTE